MKKETGSVALITVVVLSGILLASGLTVILMSSDIAGSSRSYAAMLRLGMSSRTCLEEGLYQLKEDVGYTGTVNFTWNGDTCDGVVTDHPTDPDVKVITVDATYDEYSRSEVFNVDISGDTFVILD